MPATSGVDTHAHVFEAARGLAPGRRYEPREDATLPDYLAMLTANGVSHGVLVQPSFLGTDNSYLLGALRTSPQQLRGIAVVDRDAPDDTLDELQGAGVVGVRLNLIGRSTPDFGAAEWASHLARVAERGWQIEVHAEAATLPSLLPPLLHVGAAIVIDHFGRPAPSAGVDDPGFRFLLRQGGSRRIWVKLSAAYRLGDGEAGPRTALKAVPMLRDAFGTDRLIWGSDWPHTQFEHVATPGGARLLLDAWLPDPADRRMVLRETPSLLFGFASDA